MFRVSWNEAAFILHRDPAGIRMKEVRLNVHLYTCVRIRAVFNTPAVAGFMSRC